MFKLRVIIHVIQIFKSLLIILYCCYGCDKKKSIFVPRCIYDLSLSQSWSHWITLKIRLNVSMHSSLLEENIILLTYMYVSSGPPFELYFSCWISVFLGIYFNLGCPFVGLCSFRIAPCESSWCCIMPFHLTKHSAERGRGAPEGVFALGTKQARTAPGCKREKHLQGV